MSVAIGVMARCAFRAGRTMGQKLTFEHIRSRLWNPSRKTKLGVLNRRPSHDIAPHHDRSFCRKAHPWPGTWACRSRPSRDLRGRSRCWTRIMTVRSTSPKQRRRRLLCSTSWRGDHDGTLDKRELARRLSAKELAAADPDHDGTLTKDEYLALVEQRLKRRSGSRWDARRQGIEQPGRPGSVASLKITKGAAELSKLRAGLFVDRRPLGVRGGAGE